MSDIIAQQIGVVIFAEIKKYPVPGPPYLDGSIGWGARPIDLGRAVLDSRLVVPVREIASLQKRLDARNDAIARVEALLEQPHPLGTLWVAAVRGALDGSADA